MLEQIWGPYLRVGRQRYGGRAKWVNTILLGFVGVQLMVLLNVCLSVCTLQHVVANPVSSTVWRSTCAMYWGVGVRSGWLGGTPTKKSSGRCVPSKRRVPLTRATSQKNRIRNTDDVTHVLIASWVFWKSVHCDTALPFCVKSDEIRIRLCATLRPSQEEFYFCVSVHHSIG